MQVTVETTSGLGRRMHIKVPSDRLESQVEVKLKEAAQQARIKGFRPGKVPLREVRRRFGPGIRQEVGSELMQSSFTEAIQEQKVAPAGMPEIEDITLEPGKDLEFTAVFDVFPEIIPNGFTGIKVERPNAEVTDADIDKMIETLRDQRLRYKEVERPSQDKDKVNVNFEGFIDGEAFAGGTAEGAEVIIGSGNMIAGFEEGLTGCSKGEAKELQVTFPEDYQATELAGKEAIFKVTVNNVSEPEMPELDDEFFKEFGVAEGGLEAFREEVKSNLKKELDAAIKNKVLTQVMDGLIETNEIEIPQALVRQEVDSMRQDAVRRFGGGDQIDPSVLPSEMFEAQAIRRVSLGLIVNAIVEQHDIRVDDERVKAMVDDLASTYEEPEQVRKYYYSDQEQLQRIQNVALEQQVVDRILETAQVTDITMSYDEAIKPPPAPHSEDNLEESAEISLDEGEEE